MGLLGLLLAAGYRHLIAVYQRDPEAGSLRLAYFSAAIVYSFTEAGFRMLDPIWIFLLLAIIAVPETTIRQEVELPLDESQQLAPVRPAPEDEEVYVRIY